MRSASISRLAVASVVPVLLTSCLPDDLVAPSIDLLSLEVSTSGLTFTESLQSEQIVYGVTNRRNGEPASGPVTFSSSNDLVATVTWDGVVTAGGKGTATVTVSMGQARSFVEVEVQATYTPFALGVNLDSLSAPAGGWRYFSFEVPAGPTDRVLEVRQTGGVGNPDLDLSSACSWQSITRNELCGLISPPAGTYNVALHARGGFEGVSLEARIVPVTALSNGVALSGIAAGQGDLAYFTMDVPGGSTVDLTTTGDSGDVDLFGFHEPYAFSRASLYSVDWFNLDWGYEPSGCKSVAGTTSEACTVPVARENDTVLVVLLGVEAFADLSLTANVSP
jgi:hypothetical protein